MSIRELRGEAGIFSMPHWFCAHVVTKKR